MDAGLIGLVLFLILAGVHGGETEGENANEDSFEKAVFAGGCFWCMQPAFDRLEGVISTVVGYTGGTVENPTYEQVCSGKTGHTEAIEIVFDPAKISFRELVETFWKNINPVQPNGQFADRGSQYRTVIFYQNEGQRQMAEISKRELEKSGKFGGSGIETEIQPVMPFYEAETYHQEYYLKEPMRYTLYKIGSGRESFLEKVWGHKKKEPGRAE
jgi:methionine-S-sulfoxide reductase